MKYFKIEIKKDRKESTTNFNYPKGYKASLFSPIYYENKGLDIEHCIASANDDVQESNGIVELSVSEANSEIEDYILNDKDITNYDETKYASLDEFKQDLINKKKIV